MKSIITTLLLGATCLVYSQVPSYISTQGLAGWWSFSGNAIDSSIHANNGIIHGATSTSDRFGSPNRAYYFDGVNDYISIPNDSSLTANQYTISLWAKADVTPTNGYLIAKGCETSLGNNVSYRMYYSGNNLTADNWTPGRHYAQTPANTIDTSWINFVCTYNGNRINVFKNGVLIKTLPASGTLAYNIYELTIGTRLWGGNCTPDGFFKGKIDDIGLWSRALSTCEIQDLYSSQVINQTLILPINIDFESEATIIDTGVHVLSNCWVAGKAASHSNVNWRVNWETPSPQTGPPLSFDWNLWVANQFLYLEATGNMASAYDSASFYSTPIELTGWLNPHLSFDYHMYGAQMGTLQVDIFDGSQWHFGVWSVSGQQHLETDPFTKLDIDLSSFIGDTIIVQFKGIKNGGAKSDMAIDNISLVDEWPCKKVQSPYAGNLLSHSATVFWTDTTSPQFYKIYYGLEGFTPDSTSLFLISTADSVLINNLKPGATYHVYIETFCDSINFSSLAGPLAFTTPCGPFKTPFLEDFENIYDLNNWWTWPPTEMPSCWDTVGNRIDMYDGAVYVETAQNGQTPSDALLLQSGYTTSSQIIVSTPEIIGLDSLNKRLSFDAFCQSGGGGPWFYFPLSQAQLIVGTIGNSKDSSTFHPIDTLPVPFWINTHFEYYLDSASLYNRTDLRIAFGIQGAFNNPYQQWMFMDNVMVDDIPPCPKPTNLMVVQTTTNTADIAFSSNGNRFFIEYDSLGFNLGTGIIDSSITTSKTLSNLTPGTKYDLYVQNDCKPTDSLSDWTGPVSFRTECDLIAVPYFEDFSLQGNVQYSSINDIDNTTCWTGVQNSGSPSACGFWNTYGSGNNPGGMGLFIPGGNIDLHDTEMVYSPKFIGLDSGIYQAHFWIRNLDNSAYNKVIVGTASDKSNISSFHPLDTFRLKPDYNNYYEYVVWINTSNGYNGTDSILAFQYIQNNKVANSFILDDVSIELIDSCAKPMSAFVDSITTNSAWLSWKGLSTSYIIEYGTSGFVPGSGTKDTVSSTQFQLSGLNPGTAYKVYIHNNCSFSNSTNFVGPISFTTLCSSKNVPIYESFDNSPDYSDAPLCWSLIATDANTTSGYIRPNTNGHYKSYRNVYMLSSNNSNQSDIAALISPQINGLANGDKKISFYSSAEYDWNNSILYVATFGSPDDVSTMHIIDTIEIPYTKPISNQYTVYIDSASGFNMADEYIGFVSITDSVKWSHTYIDNVLIENIPSCSPPYDFKITASTSNAVGLKWKSTFGSVFRIKYGLTGFTGAGAQKTVNQSFEDTITNLQANTSYDFYIRDNCNASWVGPISIRTECNSPMRGIYTVGGVSGARNFLNLNDALRALENCGVDSSVVIQLAAVSYFGLYEIHTIPGSSPSNNVTIQGVGTLQSKMVNASTTAVFSLFETRHLTLENIEFVNNGGTAVATDRIHNVHFNNCSFKMPVGSGAGIDSELSGLSSDVSITNSVFEGGGPEVITISDFDTLTIEANHFKNSGQWGMHLSGMKHVEIVKNQMDSGGIYMFGIKDAIIDGNTINTVGEGMFLVAFSLDVYSENRISNNMIYSSGTGLKLSDIQSSSIIHNTVKSGSGAMDAISTLDIVEFHNNIFYGSRAFTINSYGNTVMEHNCYYSTASILASIDGEDYFGLPMLKVDYPQDNVFSLEGDPGFLSSTNLHVKGILVNNMGDNLNSTSFDIDGDIRPSPGSANVDMGADEFDISPIDLATVSFFASNMALCEGVPISLNVEVQNRGTDTLKSATFIVDAFGQNQVIQQNFSIPPYTYDTLSLGTLSMVTLSGNQTITVVGTVAGDTILYNDTVSSDFYIAPFQNLEVGSIRDSLCTGDSTKLFIRSSAVGSFIWVLNTDTILSNASLYDTIWSKPMGAAQIYNVYHVPGAGQCILHDTILKLYSLPDPTSVIKYLIGPPDSLSRSVSFSSGRSLNADSVYWDFGDGNYSSDSSISHSYTQNGVYSVKLYSYNICGVDTATLIITVAGIGLQEIVLDGNVSIFPNPNSGTFTIQFSGEAFSGDLEIYSSRGQLVYRQKVNKVEELELDLELSKGVYIVSLRSTAKGQQMSQLLIE